MLRWSILIIVQRDATQSSLFIILQVHSTCFGCQIHPSSGVHKTVTTGSGTGHIFCGATSLQHSQAWPRSCNWPRWREVAAQKIWLVPEPVVTVLFTPDDGCGWHPKHVQWTCRIINRLLCVASRWTIIIVHCFLCLISYEIHFLFHACFVICMAVTPFRLVDGTMSRTRTPLRTRRR